MNESAIPKETSFEYGRTYQETMLVYYRKSKVASEDNTEYLRVRLAHELVNRFVVNRLGPKLPQDITVVDIGCSVGLLAIEFARKGFQTFGIDFDPVAIEMARTLNSKEGTDAKFIQMDVSDWNLNHPVDIALCFDIFEHLHDDELGVLLYGIRRALSHGGFLAFHTLPLQYDYLFWNDKRKVIEFPPKLRPFRNLSPKRFSRLVEMYAKALDIKAIFKGRRPRTELIKKQSHCNPLSPERCEDILRRAQFDVIFMETGFLGESQLDPIDKKYFHKQSITHRSLRGVAVPKKKN